MGLTNLRSDPKLKRDRKFEQKIDFYNLVKKHDAALVAKRSIGKKKKRRTSKAYDLANLAESLPELTQALTQPTAFKLTCKNRNKLVMKEGIQMRTVLNHPAFQLNPLAAIQQHLESTQPFTDEKPKKKIIQNGKKKRANGKKRSKASSEPQAMDV